jgi:magnesium transporter
MITYLNQTMLKPEEITSANISNLKSAVWIDLLSPTELEENQVEQYINIDIPTPGEMDEIELSSRLYKNNDKLFMTAMTIAQSHSTEPKLEPITFILTPQQLFTLRYIEPRSFSLFISRIKSIETEQRTNPVNLLIGLIDSSIDRLADILEFVGSQLDDYSKLIFHNKSTHKLNYQKLFQQIGAAGDLNTKARESLITFNRLITFFEQTKSSMLDHDNQTRLNTSNRDLTALNDHSNFLSTKINFLLDATLGMVNIEQNNIIKLFSVAAVIFLPPTLIASIYGMNFHFMPELSWKYGYLFAIGLMGLASWLPYKFFKFKKWL